MKTYYDVLIYTFGNVKVSANTLTSNRNETADPFCAKRSQEFYDAFNQRYNVKSWACGRYGQRTYSRELGILWRERMERFIAYNRTHGVNIDFSIQMSGHPTMIQPFPYFIVTDFLPNSSDEELSVLDSESVYPIRKSGIHEQDAVYQNATGVICFSPLTYYAVRNFHQVEDRRLTIICSGVTGHVGKKFKKIPEKLLLWVGTDYNRKGGEVVLEAFKIMHDKDPEYKLYYVGINQKIDYPGVTVYPFLFGEDLAILDDLYKRALVCILPSQKECLGLVYLEAMARKTPVIVTSRGGMAEIIRRCQGGRVVPPDNIKSMIEAITELTSNPEVYRRYSENAYRFSYENTRWDVFTERADDAIRKWLAGDFESIPKDYDKY